MAKSRSLYRLLTLMLILLLGACTVGPDFKPPQAQLPPQWAGPAGDVPSRTYASHLDTAWWQCFHDSELSSLVQRLGRQNLDLAEAAERIAQGRAQKRAAAAAALPQLDAGLSYQRDRQSPEGILHLVQPSPGAPLDYNYYQDAIEASWELDLFGRVRRTVEAQQANTQAAIEERRAIALDSVAELALDYMQLRGAQARLAIVQHNLELADSNTGLVRERISDGTASRLDLAQAQAQASAIRAQLPPLHTAQTTLINAIGLLLAEPPRALSAELSPARSQPPLPPTVPVGLPAELARRRPDIREAEARLHAATAETGIAVAAFYPDISLNGSFGMQTLEFGKLFDTSARAASAGPGLYLPIFEGGRLRAQLRLRKSQQREAAIGYQQTVLRAWHEVDDAMTAYHDVQSRHAALQQALSDGQTALSVARDRYAQGSADFLNVIAAEQTVLSEESQVADSTTALESRLIQLYKALGGGWEYAG